LALHIHLEGLASLNRTWNCPSFECLCLRTRLRITGPLSSQWCVARARLTTSSRILHNPSVLLQSATPTGAVAWKHGPIADHAVVTCLYIDMSYVRQHWPTDFAPAQSKVSFRCRGRHVPLRNAPIGCNRSGLVQDTGVGVICACSPGLKRYFIHRGIWHQSR